MSSKVLLAERVYYTHEAEATSEVDWWDRTRAEYITITITITIKFCCVPCVEARGVEGLVAVWLSFMSCR